MLPIARTAKRIVLIGGHADVGVLSGGGSSQVRSTGGVPVEIPLTEGQAKAFARVTYHASSPLHALRTALPGATITFSDGRDPAAAAAAVREADVAIVFATQWRTEAQDLPSLALPDGQDALIEAVAAANPRTAVVLETGGAVTMPWLDRVPAVVAAWYPGQRGAEALTRLLLGDVDFTGRLPLTFPRAATQLPRTGPADPEKPIDYVEGANVGYRWFAARKEAPLFAFGHGLSYTRFTYAKPKFEGATASLEVRNTGTRAGTAIPQLYVADDNSPPRLAGWSRVDLLRGQTRRVTLTADPRILARRANGAWTTPPGQRLILATDAQTRIAEKKVRISPD